MTESTFFTTNEVNSPKKVKWQDDNKDDSSFSLQVPSSVCLEVGDLDELPIKAPPLMRSYSVSPNRNDSSRTDSDYLEEAEDSNDDLPPPLIRSYSVSPNRNDSSRTDSDYLEEAEDSNDDLPPPLMRSYSISPNRNDLSRTDSDYLELEDPEDSVDELPIETPSLKRTNSVYLEEDASEESEDASAESEDSFDDLPPLVSPPKLVKVNTLVYDVASEELDQEDSSDEYDDIIPLISLDDQEDSSNESETVLPQYLEAPKMRRTFRSDVAQYARSLFHTLKPGERIIFYTNGQSNSVLARDSNLLTNTMYLEMMGPDGEIWSSEIVTESYFN